MSDHLDMSELLEVFFEEADEQLQHLDEGFLALERDPGDLGLVNEIFRAAHTLKGSSATMGFEQIASLTHTMESLLDKIRSGQQPVTQDGIDGLLKAVDVLRQLIEQSRSGSPAAVSMDEVLEALKGVGGEAASAASPVKRDAAPSLSEIPKDCIRIEATVSKECAMPSVRGFMILNALSGKGDIQACRPDQENLDVLQPGGVMSIDFKPSAPRDEIAAALHALCEIEVAILDPSKQPQRAAPGPESRRTDTETSATHTMQTVRVGVDRLDTLMNLVGELVIDRTRIGQIEGAMSSRYEGEVLVGGLNEASLHIGRVINELQEQIMRIRMLPVDQVFNRFPRMVRDTAQKAGKKINFVISGQDTELDRSILEDIVDPITHLLRNSIDHGLETPEDRVRLGKSETGTVQLVAKQEENRIVIEVEDDGRGISVDKVKRAAIAKGTISADAAERMSERDALQLIFGAGVSTAEKVTDVSGRGVGMDVVKSNIERLSGAVEVNTEVGVGTRISLHLPLTLAIVQALITKVENRVFAIPLTSVVETSRCRKSEISTIEGHPVLQFRGTVLPLVNLETVFPSKHRQSGGLKDETVLVVVRSSGQLIGIAVDSLVGEQEVVIKSLGSYFGQVEGISGAALMGDGGIALIVDVAGLPGILERERSQLAA
jgi:two-component system, chemotaxis family, sensor kinase CheA